MRVSKLTLQNFKSFRDATVQFGPFNVVIGANASGKSNLVQAFQFLKDIAEHGLENAVSLQGGVEFLRNMGSSPEEPIRISIEFDSVTPDISLIGLLDPTKHISIPLHFTYTLEFNDRSSDNELEINYEEMSQRIQVAEFPIDFPSELNPIAEGSATLTRKLTEIEFNADSDIESMSQPRTLHLLNNAVLKPANSIFTMPVASLFVGIPMHRFSVYDIDPRLPKRGSIMTGKSDLESDGSNLAIVLNDILRSSEQSRKFHNLLGDLIPFADKMSVNRIADNSLLFSLQEAYSPGRDMPASFLSDGTIGLTSIIIALAFENNDTTVLEEPDRNIHPRLISRLTDLMKDVSRGSQILVTTHNPEFVRCAGLDNLILVSRDKDGFSKVTKPADSDIVKTFLSEEIGIQDLYVDGFLTMGV